MPRSPISFLGLSSDFSAFYIALPRIPSHCLWGIFDGAARKTPLADTGDRRRICLPKKPRLAGSEDSAFALIRAVANGSVGHSRVLKDRLVEYGACNHGVLQVRIGQVHTHQARVR